MIPKVLASPEAVVDMEMGSLAAAAAAAAAAAIPLAIPPAELPEPHVWSLTQFYSVDFSKSRIGGKKCVFNQRTIKVCVSCW